MRVIVVGLGNQGTKRLRVAGDDVVATVDPINSDASYSSLDDVDSESYDAALVCTPDDSKIELLNQLITAGKHVLVEKPILCNDNLVLTGLEQLARANNVCCYTAYNHRFEPHLVNAKAHLDSGELGEVYLTRMFYGNGTARDVRDSEWRDAQMGVLSDIGSHLLDTVLFLFGEADYLSHLVTANCFENRAPDHAFFALRNGQKVFELESTMLSWRNTFRFDVFAERGSLHIDCLCKWGPSTLTIRKRVLPSGRPEETVATLEMDDPTWEAEYLHFKSLCEKGETSLSADRWINQVLKELDAQREAA